MGRLRSEHHHLQPPPACLSRTASSPSPSSDTNLSAAAPWVGSASAFAKPMDSLFMADGGGGKNRSRPPPNLELQLLTKASSSLGISGDDSARLDSTQLQLSIGSSEIVDKAETDNANIAATAADNRSSPRGSCSSSERRSAAAAAAATLREQAEEQLRAAAAEKAYAEEARRQAKRQREVAEQEFANAKRIRQQAAAELEKAEALKERAARQLNAAIMQITCHSCKHRFQQEAAAALRPAFATEASASVDNSIGLGYISAALREWEVKKT